MLCGVVLEVFFDHFGYHVDDIFDVFSVSNFGHVFDVSRVGTGTRIAKGGVDPANEGIPPLGQDGAGRSTSAAQNRCFGRLSPPRLFFQWFVGSMFGRFCLPKPSHNRAQIDQK